MPGRKAQRRAAAALGGREKAARLVLDIGAKIRAARRRRHWSLAQLGQRAGLSPSRVGQIELGKGAGAGLEVLCALAAALNIPLRVEFGRDRIEDTADAGHLKIQELTLRFGRQVGFATGFEIPTRSAEPAHSTDVHLRDDRRRLLVLVECWNTFGNSNQAVRSNATRLFAWRR